MARQKRTPDALRRRTPRQERTALCVVCCRCRQHPRELRARARNVDVAQSSAVDVDAGVRAEPSPHGVPGASEHTRRLVPPPRIREATRCLVPLGLSTAPHMPHQPPHHGWVQVAPPRSRSEQSTRMDCRRRAWVTLPARGRCPWLPRQSLPERGQDMGFLVGLASSSGMRLSCSSQQAPRGTLLVCHLGAQAARATLARAQEAVSSPAVGRRRVRQVRRGTMLPQSSLRASVLTRPTTSSQRGGIRFGRWRNALRSGEPCSQLRSAAKSRSAC